MMTSRISRPTSSRSAPYNDFGGGTDDHGETHSLDDPRTRSRALGPVLPAGLRPRGVAPPRVPDVQAAVPARCAEWLRDRTHMEPGPRRAVHARHRLRPRGLLRRRYRRAPRNDAAPRLRAR